MTRKIGVRKYLLFKFCNKEVRSLEKTQKGSKILSENAKRKQVVSFAQKGSIFEVTSFLQILSKRMLQKSVKIAKLLPNLKFQLHLL